MGTDSWLKWEEHEGGAKEAKVGRFAFYVENRNGERWLTSSYGGFPFWDERLEDDDAAEDSRVVEIVCDEYIELGDAVAPVLRWNGGLGEVSGLPWLLCASTRGAAVLLCDSGAVVARVDWGLCSIASVEDARKWAERELSKLGVVFRVEDGE